MAQGALLAANLVQAHGKPDVRAREPAPAGRVVSQAIPRVALPDRIRQQSTVARQLTNVCQRLSIVAQLAVPLTNTRSSANPCRCEPAQCHSRCHLHRLRYRVVHYGLAERCAYCRWCQLCRDVLGQLSTNSTTGRAECHLGVPSKRGSVSTAALGLSSRRAAAATTTTPPPSTTTTTTPPSTTTPTTTRRLVGAPHVPTAAKLVL
jgi:hypothetical protein